MKWYNKCVAKTGGNDMIKTITGHFDGKVIVPDKPVKLPVGKRLRIQIALAVATNAKKPTANGKKRTKRLKIAGTGMFDSGIPDLATNKKYMEGFGKS
jgi:hypothetical protein